MSQLLRTEDEWLAQGLVVRYKEESLHKDKHGESLWRADQVETPYFEDVTESEDLEDTE